MSESLVIRSEKIAFPDGVRPGAVVVTDGAIAEIAPYDAGADVDLGRVALLPGLVDTHVHVNEPGRTEWEGFASATAAAAAGGITTICDMPLNSVPVTTSVGALRAKLDAARGQCHVDVAFWGGAVPGNLAELRPLADAGVAGFKCFLSEPGIPEFSRLDAAGLRTAMKELADAGPAGAGVPLIVHAEDPAELTEPADGGYGAYVASRPPVAERRAIETVVSAAAATGARAHIVHLAAAECAALIGAAQAAGIALTAETCPHYLYFCAEEVPDGGAGLAGLAAKFATEFKCAPPIRYAANREALWRALGAGVIDCVVSDHSPCAPDLKRGDFATAWGGIASLQVALPAVWTGARQRGHSLADVARWMAERPAGLAGLPAKGRIAVGADADLVAFDSAATITVEGGRLRHRSPVTPYEGRTLTGKVECTWLRGREVLPGGAPGDVPRGRFARRGGGWLE